MAKLKMTRKVIDKIRKLLLAGWKQCDIAKELQVSQTNVSRAKQALNIIPKCQRLWSPLYKNEKILRKLVAQGYNQYQIGKILGCSQSHVHRQLKYWGLVCRTWQLPIEKQQQIKKMHEEGFNFYQISLKLGVHWNTARKYSK